MVRLQFLRGLKGTRKGTSKRRGDQIGAGKQSTGDDNWHTVAGNTHRLQSVGLAVTLERVVSCRKKESLGNGCRQGTHSRRIGATGLLHYALGGLPSLRYGRAPRSVKESVASAASHHQPGCAVLPTLKKVNPFGLTFFNVGAAGFEPATS